MLNITFVLGTYCNLLGHGRHLSKKKNYLPVLANSAKSSNWSHWFNSLTRKVVNIIPNFMVYKHVFRLYQGYLRY